MGQDVPGFKHLGTIEVKVMRVQVLGKSYSASAHGGHSGDTSPLGLSEKALKGQAISHSTKGGRPRVEVMRTTIKVMRLDQNPIMTFLFLYRSRSRSIQLYDLKQVISHQNVDDLEITGIVPRQVTPPPLPASPITGTQLRMEDIKVEGNRDKAEKVKVEITEPSNRKRRAEDGDCEVVWTKSANAKRYKGRGTADRPVNLDDE
ncbi:MAG: hypothetical protein M1814_003539 [Vezdaea aestivalis]|nr:MAG: hypothetical protein M1814_003539 [Vezdaea aestivalis]